MTVCQWARWCREPAAHRVELEIRPGMVSTETVCDQHLEQARKWGYRRTGPAEPQPRNWGHGRNGSADEQGRDDA